MTGLSVIIPSKTASNLNACTLKVFKKEKDANLIVVDDGLDINSVWWKYGNREIHQLGNGRDFQIVFLAKHLTAKITGKWDSLNVPRGQSKQFTAEVAVGRKSQRWTFNMLPNLWNLSLL